MGDRRLGEARWGKLRGFDMDVGIDETGKNEMGWRRIHLLYRQYLSVREGQLCRV